MISSLIFFPNQSLLGTTYLGGDTNRHNVMHNKLNGQN